MTLEKESKEVMRIPESLSATVYMMRRPWQWTLAVWVLGAAVVALMMGHGVDVMSFLTGIGIGFVGAMPLAEDCDNVLHNAIGLLTCLLSQVWLLTTAVPWWAVVVCWVAYVALLPLMRRWWCLAAELLCVASVLVGCLI